MASKILLVDDEKFFLEGLKEGLSEYKDTFTTDICFSVNEAIKLFKKAKYDMIISDVQMPRKNGLYLFNYLKKQNYQGGFIAMTAYATPEFLKITKRLGAFDVILKPFDFIWFRDKILDYLSRDNGNMEGKEAENETAEITNDVSIIGLNTNLIQDNKKEENMNVKKLIRAIEIQKESMGDGLLATDIFSSKDGQSLAAWNSNPQACALFNRITKYMKEAIDGAGFPPLNRYYILELADDKLVIVIMLGDFQWGVLADLTKIQLGLILNVIMPKMIEAFGQAMKD